tara:strand:- start:413 stop:712 length:300 start_codon:yes stop_codon:yes gene_type:complete
MKGFILYIPSIEYFLCTYCKCRDHSRVAVPARENAVACANVVVLAKENAVVLERKNAVVLENAVVQYHERNIEVGGDPGLFENLDLNERHLLIKKGKGS